ncbi:MAG: MATE family efflux transporter [Hydrogenophaga sp.]|uniref:MATE family efflux transporter n=1 Tax=Hydrogenophaga sp. TaxID=1904254 RepID=UPI0025BF5D6E|nr:MATE family efflux transporter [Hydrogenophaga sp.]MBT9552186.1 MATE family efflux transporter [Hydrogenophaga sp.]
MSEPARAADQPLLTAPILPLLLRFALPNMGAMLATALAAIAETVYVGGFGSPALAGMALVFPFVMFQMMLSAGAMGGGVSSAVSRALGAGHPERANALAVHALWIALVAGTVYMVAMLSLGETLLALLGGQGEALAQAMAYANVAFLGSVFVWLVNTLASVIRGSGNMAVPSATLFVVALLQVALGGALGLGWGPLPRLGMAGVAAGSVVAYGVGAAWLWRYLVSGRSRIALHVRGTRLERARFADILRVGAVASISPLQTVLTILILTRLVAQFGTDALAGYGIGTRLEFLLVPIAFAVGVASVPLVGMAIGAGQVARARQAAWTAAGLATAILGGLGLVVTLAPDLWTGLFTQDPAVLAAAAGYFRWAGPVYGLFGLGLSLYFSSLGAGKALGPVLAGTLRLVMVAGGGALLAMWQTPTWTIFALLSAGMAVYGISSVLFVRYTPWAVEKA